MGSRGVPGVACAVPVGRFDDGWMVSAVKAEGRHGIFVKVDRAGFAKVQAGWAFPGTWLTTTSIQVGMVESL